jgi:predicted chitinase
MVTDDELRRIMPNCAAAKREAYLPFIQQAMQEFEITSYLREAAFLAQLAHESGELRYMEEIASGSAYEGRADLGNTQPGDGKRYKGRGPIQLTGRANYKRYGDLLALDLVNNPTIAATPQVGFRIAGQYWKLNGLNELADKGLQMVTIKRKGQTQQVPAFDAITFKINGGFNGKDDRTKYYNRAKQVLNKDDAADASDAVDAGGTAAPPPTPVDAGGSSSPAYPGSVLRQGSKGANVQTMQQRLSDLGYALTVDGNFGPGTRAALEEFQGKKGITCDGCCGPGTWAALWG